MGVTHFILNTYTLAWRIRDILLRMEGSSYSGSRINARRVDVSRFAASGAQQQRTHQHGEQH